MLPSVPFSDIRKQRHRRIRRTCKDYTAIKRQEEDWSVGRHPLEASLFVDGPLTTWRLLAFGSYLRNWIDLPVMSHKIRQSHCFTCGSKLTRSSSVRVAPVCRGLGLDSTSQETNEPLEIVCQLYFCVHVCCLGVSGSRLLHGCLRVTRGALSPSA